MTARVAASTTPLIGPEYTHGVARRLERMHVLREVGGLVVAVGGRDDVRPLPQASRHARTHARDEVHLGVDLQLAHGPLGVAIEDARGVARDEEPQRAQVVLQLPDVLGVGGRARGRRLADRGGRAGLAAPAGPVGVARVAVPVAAPQVVAAIAMHRLRHRAHAALRRCPLAALPSFHGSAARARQPYRTRPSQPHQLLEEALGLLDLLGGDPLARPCRVRAVRCADQLLEEALGLFDLLTPGALTAHRGITLSASHALENSAISRKNATTTSTTSQDPCYSILTARFAPAQTRAQVET